MDDTMNAEVQRLRREAIRGDGDAVGELVDVSMMLSDGEEVLPVLARVARENVDVFQTHEAEVVDLLRSMDQQYSGEAARRRRALRDSAGLVEVLVERGALPVTGAEKVIRYIARPREVWNGDPEMEQVTLSRCVDAVEALAGSNWAVSPDVVRLVSRVSTAGADRAVDVVGMLGVVCEAAEAGSPAEQAAVDELVWLTTDEGPGGQSVQDEALWVLEALFDAGELDGERYPDAESLVLNE